MTRRSRANSDEVYAQRLCRRRRRRAEERAVACDLQVPPALRAAGRGAVLDLACDRGDFIRNIDAVVSCWACDMRYMSRSICRSRRPVRGRPMVSLSRRRFQLDHFDPRVHEQLPRAPAEWGDAGCGAAACRPLRVLKPGGRAMVLQPNIRLDRAAYWDFIDHNVALTEKSLVEAAVARGLPYGHADHALPPVYDERAAPRCRAGSRGSICGLPPAWFVFGKQTLYVGSQR